MPRGTQNFVPKVKPGHVVPGISLDRVKSRLNQVRGALVECPLVRITHFARWLSLTGTLQDFLIDDKEFVSGPEWRGLNPTLPIYI